MKGACTWFGVPLRRVHIHFHVKGKWCASTINYVQSSFRYWDRDGDCKTKCDTWLLCIGIWMGAAATSKKGKLNTTQKLQGVHVCTVVSRYNEEGPRCARRSCEGRQQSILSTFASSQLKLSRSCTFPCARTTWRSACIGVCGHPTRIL